MPHTRHQKFRTYILATMVGKRICSAVQFAGPFSLLTDESKDINKTEQLTVVLRYVCTCQLW